MCNCINERSVEVRHNQRDNKISKTEGSKTCIRKRNRGWGKLLSPQPRCNVTDLITLYDKHMVLTL